MSFGLGERLQRTKRGLLAGGVLSLGMVVLVVAAQFRTAATQDPQTEERTAPRLFAGSYAEGHELAGFSGRPMLIVIGDRRTPGWDQFLADCEKDPKLVAHLTTTFQGVSVDAASDVEAMVAYGNPDIGTVLVKDLHGPIRGILKGEYTCADLLRVLDEALPYIAVEKSPGYLRLLAGTDLLDELVGKAAFFESQGGVNDGAELRKEASRLLALLEHFERGSQAVDLARARADALNLAVETK